MPAVFADITAIHTDWISVPEWLRALYHKSQVPRMQEGILHKSKHLAIINLPKILYWICE
jgi:hypothetical protein